MTYDFAIQAIPAMAVLSIRDRVAMGDFQAFLGGAFPELFAHIGRHGVIATGHPFVLYHAFGPELIDAEVCVPVAGPAPASDRIATRTIAAATVVRTVHLGLYEELGTAYAALAEWLDDHGYAVAGPVRERFLTGVADDVPPDLYRTELDQPVVPLEASVDAAERRAPVGVG